MTDPQSIFARDDESTPESLRTIGAGHPARREGTATIPESLHVWTMANAGDGPPAVPQDASAAPAAYHVYSMIGRGGMGEVYEAVQTSLGRIVAVKRLAREYEQGSADTLAGATAAFRTEAVIAGSLEHPNILPIHDLGADAAGRPLLAMKLVEGSSWDRLLRADFESGKPPAELLARHLPVLVALGQAVSFAHSRGIVHRDIKPSQVLVGPFGEVLLTDWGLAIHAPAPGQEPAPTARRRLPPNVPTRDSATSPSGTPALMAPEQTYESAARVGPWTDVYALGGTLYFLLTGTYPHEAATSLASLEKARLGAVEPPSRRAPDRAIPPELEALAMDSLQRQPEGRPGSAAEFVARLNDHLTGTTRRAEAAALVAETRALAESAGEDYRALGDCIARLDRALALSPEQADATSLRTELLERFARAALAHSDLTLARAMAERLGPGGARDGILASAAGAERELARQARTRRLAITAAAALLGIVVVGGALSLDRIRHERDAAESAGRLAEEKRRLAEASLAVAASQGAGANDLVLYVLDELKSQLDTQLTPGRGMTVDQANEASHEIAGGVAGRVVAYYRSLDPAQWPPDLRREHLRRLLAATERISELSRLDESIELTSRALELARTLGEGDSPDMALVAERRAENLRDAGRDEEAISAYRETLGMMERLGGYTPAQRASVLASIGESLSARGRWEEALATLREAESLLQGGGGDAAIVRIEVLAMMGRVHGRMGAHPQAITAMREALRLSDELPAGRGANGWLVASELAGSLAAQSSFDEALELATGNLEWTEKEYGPRSPKTANALNVKGAVLTRMDRHAEALPLMERALGILEEAFGPGHTATVALLGNVATIRGNLGRNDEAIPAFERVLAWRRANLGPDHPATATTMVNYAGCLAEVGRGGEAEAFYRRALAIREAKLDPRSPQLMDVRRHLVLLLSAKARDSAQAGDADEARRIAAEALGLMGGREADFAARYPDAGFEHAFLLDILGRTEEGAGVLREFLGRGGASRLAGTRRAALLPDLCARLGIEVPPPAPHPSQ